MFEILHEHAAVRRSLRPESPPDLDRLIDSCLSKDAAAPALVRGRR